MCRANFFPGIGCPHEKQSMISIAPPDEFLLAFVLVESAGATKVVENFMASASFVRFSCTKARFTSVSSFWLSRSFNVLKSSDSDTESVFDLSSSSSIASADFSFSPPSPSPRFSSPLSNPSFPFEVAFCFSDNFCLATRIPHLVLQVKKGKQLRISRTTAWKRCLGHTCSI